MSSPTSPHHEENKKLASALAENKRYKKKLEQMEENFVYWEESNIKLQQEADQHAKIVEQKEKHLEILKRDIGLVETACGNANAEVDNLKHKQSVLEAEIEASKEVIESVERLEKLALVREKELRSLAVELKHVKTERDNSVAEIKSLEGDIYELHQAQVANEGEIDSLHTRLGVYEKYIPNSNHLQIDVLDTTLQDFIREQGNKVLDIDDSYDPTPAMMKSVADELAGLSDDESEDGTSERGRSIRASSRQSSFYTRETSAAGVQKLKPYELSNMFTIQIHPSVVETILTHDTDTQTSPLSSPTTTSTPPTRITSTLTSVHAISTEPVLPIASVKTEKSPTSSWKKQQQALLTTSTATQTSPVASSPSEQQLPRLHASTATQTSPIASSPLEQKLPRLNASTATQTSPLPSPKTKMAPPTVDTGVQTIPVKVTPLGAKRAVQNTSTHTQTSPLPSPKIKMTPPIVDTGDQTIPVNVTPLSAKRAVQNTSTHTQTTSPPTAVAQTQTTLTPTTQTTTLTPTTEKTTTTTTKKHTNALNINRTRVATKNMSPRTLTHYKLVTNPRSKPSTRTSTLTQLFKWWENIPIGHFVIIASLISFIVAKLYLLYSMQDSLVEYPWARVNGYAPQDAASVYAAGRALRPFLLAAEEAGLWWVDVISGSTANIYRRPLSPG